MGDDKKKKGKPDSIRINFNELYEVTYWTGKWNVSAQQLHQARQATGSVLVQQIERYLKENGLLP